MLITLAMVAPLACGVWAHMSLHQFFVDGVTAGAGRAMSVLRDNGPTVDFTSSDLECGRTASVDPTFVPVYRGSTLTFQFKHDRPEDDIVAPSHAGVILIYGAPADTTKPTPAVDRATGFTKLYSGKWSASEGWESDRLIRGRGYLNVQIPKEMPLGGAVLRTELPALHEAEVMWSRNGGRGVQMYVQCVHVEVREGSPPAKSTAGDRLVRETSLAKPWNTIKQATGWPRGIAIPQGLDPKDSGYLYNMYYRQADGPNSSKDHTRYKAPGPPTSAQISMQATFGRPRL
ncbi:hypothetical protein PYCC9005_005661 [Savitreella phatthalungensis]